MLTKHFLSLLLVLSLSAIFNTVASDTPPAEPPTVNTK